jgi:hypothetical protein
LATRRYGEAARAEIRNKGSPTMSHAENFVHHAPGGSRQRHVPAVLKRLITLAIAVALSGLVTADSRVIDFEASQGYHVGTIQNQPAPPVGWGGQTPPGIPINPAIDQEVVASWPGRPASFGLQSWRISNAYTSGAFADMPFSPSLTNEAGETMAQNLAYSGGIRQNHFEVQYSFTSADPTSAEQDSYVSTSPDRGDGARMSYIRLEDHLAGIEVWFDDYQDNAPRGQSGSSFTAQQGCGPEDDFTDIKVATVSRNRAHTVKLAIDFIDGPHNDVVKVYVDGSLRHTGTTWEDYFRWCPESGGGTGTTTDQSRTVDSMLFRVGGAEGPMHLPNLGRGFLIDNLFYSSSNAARGCDGHHGDGEGDVDDGHGRHGHSRFHKDECDGRGGDDVEHDDDHEGHHFKSTSVNSSKFSTADDGRSVTMTGIGVDNGLPVGFTMVAVDHDGILPATYSIILTNGYTFVGEFVNGTLSIQ